MGKEFSVTKKIVLSGMFLAMALIIGRFRIVIPYAGIPFLKISLSGPIYKFIALLLGPVYGGIVPAIADFIGAMINPIGSYIWMFTVVAFIKGFLIGFMWDKTKIFRQNYNMFYVSLVISILIPDFIASVLNTFVMKFYLLLPENIFIAVLISRLVKEFFMTIFNIIILVVMIKAYKKIIYSDGGKNEF